MMVPCPYDAMVECSTEIVQFCENCAVYRSLNKKDTDDPKEYKSKKGYEGKELTPKDIIIFGIVLVLILILTVVLQ